MKAILVLEMPSGCVKCQLYDYVASRCFMTDKFQNDISEDYKPNWCPLKPMPSKKDKPTKSESFACFISGYNSCIDEILGDKE